MKREMIVAARMALATLVLVGLAYPLTVTAIARMVFPQRAAEAWSCAMAAWWAPS